jgi:hypothetical protein
MVCSYSTWQRRRLSKYREVPNQDAPEIERLLKGSHFLARSGNFLAQHVP